MWRHSSDAEKEQNQTEMHDAIKEIIEPNTKHLDAALAMLVRMS